MKKYRLKQWYPSLKQDWSKGDIAEWFDGYYWNKGKVILNGLSKNEVKNNPDFWELIEEEKPLFTTEDGVDVVNGMRIHSVRKSNFDSDSYIVDAVSYTHLRAHETPEHLVCRL